MGDGEFIFDSSKNMEWTFIAFHTNLLHECKEVLSGKRVLFKMELCSKNKTYHHSIDDCDFVDGGIYIPEPILEPEPIPEYMFLDKN